MRFLPLVALVLVTGLLAPAGADAQPQPSPGEFLCLRGAPTRHADRGFRFVPRKAMALGDRIVGTPGVKVDLKKTLGLCLPAGQDDASPALEPYDARLARTRPAQTRPAIANQHVTNRFGTDELDVKSIDAALVPSSAVLDPLPAPSSVPGTLDAFACYEAERSTHRSAAAAQAPVTIESAIGTWQFDVRAPTRLCVPAALESGASGPIDGNDAPSNAAALVCYRVALTRTKPPQGKPFPRNAQTANRFGTEQLTLATTADFCVPSDASAVDATPTPTPQQTALPTPTGPAPTPTVTPPPDFKLRIDPPSATVDIGTSGHLKATAVFGNGDTADFTERVVWSSSSESVEAPNVAGDRGRVDAVDAGSAVIAVFDEATGVTSTTTGDDAIVTVAATLERLELQPPTITRGKGESFRLRAVGHFAGGYTNSIAKRVVYASSDPTVGKPTNDAVPSEHARVLALSEGTAVLSATDPLSGLTSTASGDDATLTVVPPLERCTILNTGPILLSVDHEYQLTAHGFYPGGAERNLTQQVVWSSDLPEILDTPNADGDRSRVKGLFPGDAHVTATDSVTGLQCETTVTFQVRTPHGGLGVYTSPVWLAFTPRRMGDAWVFRAIEQFEGPPFYKFVTEQVLFSSSNPAAVLAPNVPGNHGRIVTVGSGMADVIATDPVNGNTSGPVHLRGLDGLTRIEVLHRKRDGTLSLLPLGSYYRIEVLGQFADGPAPLETDDFVVTSDNPAAVEVMPSTSFYRGSVHAVGYGVATITAVDTRTGISSAAFGESLRLGVAGPIERIELVPEKAVRRVGDSQSFAGVAHYQGGATDNVTQRLVYSSSDPTVAVATNAYGNASMIYAVAPGTAVIDATDSYVSGVSSADTGDSATITVVGPLVRLRVEPTAVGRSVGRSFQFTAIGTDADGREINLTQSVVWSSSDPTVAVASNPDGNRSRVDAVAEGTATISAFDPQDGVSSSTSHDDATFVVSGILASITLSAEKTTLTVGEAVQLTATGHLVGGGDVNLTQEVEYTSSAPGVVAADNPPGDRSRVVGVAAGTAVISARDPGTGVVTTAAGGLTLTVTAP